MAKEPQSVSMEEQVKKDLMSMAKEREISVSELIGRLIKLGFLIEQNTQTHSKLYIETPGMDSKVIVPVEAILGRKPCP